MQSSLSVLAQRRQQLLQGGADSAGARLAHLIDADSFMPMQAYTEAGAGVMAGWASVDGRRVALAVSQMGEDGGALSAAGCGKIAQAMTLALQNGVPFISILDCAGLKIQEGTAGLDALAGLLRLRAQLSGVVPQLSVVVGGCAGALGLFAAQGDVLLLDSQARLSATGAGVLAAKSGQLPGTAAQPELHELHTGLCALSDDTVEGILKKTKLILSYLPDNNLCASPLGLSEDPAGAARPELDALADGAAYDDVREIISRVADDGIFTEVTRRYGQSLITALAHVGGRAVGVIATQKSAGAPDGQACLKAARFVRLCDAFGLPLVTLVDCPGLAADLQDEQAGLLPRAAQLATALAQVKTPWVSLVLGEAAGSAYTLFCARALGPDAVLAWPYARLANLPAPAAQAVAQASGQPAPADDVWAAAQNGAVDDVIAPSQSRSALAAHLSAHADKRVSLPPRGHASAPWA